MASNPSVAEMGINYAMPEAPLPEESEQIDQRQSLEEIEDLKRRIAEMEKSIKSGMKGGSREGENLASAEDVVKDGEYVAEVRDVDGMYDQLSEIRFGETRFIDISDQRLDGPIASQKTSIHAEREGRLPKISLDGIVEINPDVVREQGGFYFDRERTGKLVESLADKGVKCRALEANGKMILRINLADENFAVDIDLGYTSETSLENAIKDYKPEVAEYMREKGNNEVNVNMGHRTEFGFLLGAELTRREGLDWALSEYQKVFMPLLNSIAVISGKQVPEQTIVFSSKPSTSTPPIT